MFRTAVLELTEMGIAELVIMVIWLAGVLVLGTSWANDMRLTLNNLAPGVDLSSFARKNEFGFGVVFAYGVIPERLTELGRIHRAKAVRTERIALVWAVSGFLLLVGLAYYRHAW
jgi:hypothetical protein